MKSNGDPDKIYETGGRVQEEKEYSEYLYKIAEEYRNHKKEIWEGRFSSESKLSILFIECSLLSSVSWFSHQFIPYPQLKLVLTVIGGVFAVLAVGAALSIARWTLFDIITSINVLRQ